MSNEADTCRTYIVPKLHASGWEDDFITEQMVLTHGRIVPIGNRHIRREGLHAKVNVFPLAAKRLGDDMREPHNGVILQVKSGEELRPFREAGRTLILWPKGASSPCGMASILDKAFKGEL